MQRNFYAAGSMDSASRDPLLLPSRLLPISLCVRNDVYVPTVNMASAWCIKLNQILLYCTAALNQRSD